MHAVVFSVTIGGDEDESRQFLREQIVPRVKEAPGFVAGYWVRLADSDQGRSVVVFESEEAARSAVEQAQAGPGVTIDSAQVGEVVASA